MLMISVVNISIKWIWHSHGLTKSPQLFNQSRAAIYWDRSSERCFKSHIGFQQTNMYFFIGQYSKKGKSVKFAV
jgi:hypothetical protein